MHKRAHIIVLGNAKGGCGKSTTAMHVIAALMARGLKVSAIDLDGQQQTMGRYLENRALFATKRGLTLPVPELETLIESQAPNRLDAQKDMQVRFDAALHKAVDTSDCVVIDCPGADTFLSRLAHAVADTLITPINDSFIDLDLIARVDPDSHQVIAPSWYSEMIWELRKRRFLKDNHALDWVIMRNRLAHTDARNKRHMGKVLDTLAPRFGFRQAPGMGERVIFRELFLRGLTLSDLKQYKTGVAMTMTHVVAHREIKDLVATLRLARPRAA